MGLTKLALKFAAPLPDIEKYERFLFIGPHPDDIEIGAGATAAKLAAAGKKVCFLICTDGRYGDGKSAADRQQLIDIRQKEAVLSAEYLGVTDVQFLGLSDGGFYRFEELVEGIAQAVARFCPQVIFAPDPSVASECHVDHLNAGKAARQIACHAPYPGIMAAHGACGSAPVEAIAFYMTAGPTKFVRTKGYLQMQLDSVFCNHLSQFPKGCREARAIALYLRLRAFDFGMRSFCGCAEGFRVLGVTHMHCLPEAE
ncbi:MAG: PIG-L family deacetylase [Lachnospiraceae bacterium]|nr:PIG-L family deacetylase [Lachnospiraceae bacterium]